VRYELPMLLGLLGRKLLAVACCEPPQFVREAAAAPSGGRTIRCLSRPLQHQAGASATGASPRDKEANRAVD
jgi:hypothetical protein